jgi:hypothetical protein
MRIFIWLAGVFLAIILIVLLILSLARPDGTDTATNEPQTLASFASSGAVASYTQQGRITSPEEHRSIVITVSSNERKIDIFAGYNGRVISSERLSNTVDSYQNFLAGLENAGFTLSRTSPSGDSVEGKCPLGTRFIYNISNVPDIKTPTWSTSCQSKDGTFAGNRNTVKQLFQNQIPDYKELTQSVRL